MTTAENLINACNAKDRTTICTLIAAIPVNEWHVTEGHATSDQAHVTVQVEHASGGTGINTYETVYVSVLLDDQDMPLYWSTFTSEELRLPNYIPIENRPQTVN